MPNNSRWPRPGGGRSFTETINVTGDQLMSKVKSLIREGNVHRIVIRRRNGRRLLSIPVNAGVVVGGAASLTAPVLTAIGAIAGAVSGLTLEVQRSQDQ